MLFVGIAVVVVILFVFAIIPGLLKLVNLILGSGSGVLSPSDTLPPQMPIIATPVSATHSATLALKGFGEPDSELIITLNGNEAAKQKIAPNGEFSSDITLTEGDNQLELWAVDAAGNQSQTKTFAILLDTQAPKLELSEPQDGQTIELRKNQLVSIKGTTEANAKVYVNGRLVYANNQGAFTSSYQLAEGENKITLEAEDKAGNKTLSEITVNFKL